MTSSHSTTVPSIWKLRTRTRDAREWPCVARAGAGMTAYKGSPTDVCQFWGDLRMRLLSVSRLPGEKQARQQWQGWVRAGRRAYILVFCPA